MAASDDRPCDYTQGRRPTTCDRVDGGCGRWSVVSRRIRVSDGAGAAARASAARTPLYRGRRIARADPRCGLHHPRHARRPGGRGVQRRRGVRQHLALGGLRDAHGATIPLQVLFTDHNMGFAAGRNATMRASRGRVVVLLDTSIELCGDIWAPLERALADEQIGVVGPYGLVTDDLKEFSEHTGPDVDAIEGYMMAFRRALLPEIGWFEEKFRFYRLLDGYESFMFKTSGYRVVAVPEVAALIEKHPHREWYSLTEDERATKSKKNFDIYKRRWHHGQSLLVANFVPSARWFGHDHPHHLGAHTHAAEELPPPGTAHNHRHQHWADHDHEHMHVHH